MSMDESISRAWLEAAIDLGIRVIAPHRVSLASKSVEVEVFLPDFGSVGGACVMSEDNRAHEHELRAAHWCSVLFESYRVYSRGLFIDTLNDWGWYGSEAAPVWFTGKSWT